MRFFSKLKSEGTVLALFLLGLCPANLSGQTVVDEFTSANFEATKGSYVAFSDVQGTSGAVYAGNSAADYGSIQLRASEKSGIVTTVSGGERVRRITVEWNSHTASSSPRALDIYGKRTAYASSGDLYEERVATRGTLIGSIPRGTSAIEIEGDYTYVGLRSADGTIYLDKLAVTWETGKEDRVETPVFSPAGGTNFVDELTVKAACTTKGATIYYTLDGADPTEGSDVFPAEGLTLDRTATVKAMAADGTLANSGIAEATYTIESLMHDGKALQSGTSHNFGDGFAKAFGIQYTDKDNTLKYVYQTSWGMTTRMIGALIMVHGDNSGLKLPPRIAPVQLMIVPIRQDAPGVLDKAAELEAALKAAGVRVKTDVSEKSPGWKFSEQEMRGIPLRAELGPKDLEKGQAVLVRRDTREKYIVPFEEIPAKAAKLLEEIQQNMYETALAHRNAHTYDVTSYEEFKTTINEKPGFIRAMWCGCQECEDKIKEDTAATARCIPFEQEQISGTCVCCGKPAKKMVYWGRAY